MKNEKPPAPAARQLATAPMFQPRVDDNTIPYTSNAHPQTEYTDKNNLLHPGALLSHQVCQQVFGSAGAARGSISFSSLVDASHKPTKEPYPETAFNPGAASAIMAAKTRK